MTVAATIGAMACGAVLCASSADASSAAISGTVHGPQGQAIAGARVQLNAFAVNRAGVHEIAIESTTSDASGKYTLAEPSASQTASLAKLDGGTINYEVDATSAGNGAILNATTTMPASQVFGASASGRSAASSSTSGPVDLSMAPLHLASGKVAPASAIRPNDCTNNYAIWNTVSTGEYSVIMGEPHTYIDMSVQWAYQQNATTTIGVALSTDGGGSWGENGSVSTTYTSGSGVTSPWYGIHFAEYEYGQFVYDKQQERFACTGPTDDYRTIPAYWTGGVAPSGNLTAYDGGNSPIWLHDQTLPAGESGEAFYGTGFSFYKTGGSGASYGAGASFAGVSLSAITNYSSSVTYTWQMGTNSGLPHVLFGANGVYPATGSGATIIYAN